MAFTKIVPAGISTSGSYTLQDLDIVGIVTATTFNGDVTGNLTGNVTGQVTVATGSTISGGTNYITASTNGSERIRIDSSGNFGIGTTSPSALVEANGGNVRMVDTNGRIYLQNGNTTNGAKIGVRGTSDATDGYLAFETNSIEFARFDSSGNFGIANQSPSTKFHLTGTDNNFITLSHATRTGKWFIQHSGVNSENLVFQQNNGTSTANSYLVGRDIHAWYTGDTERMRVTSDGSVILGAINSSNAPADVNNRIFYYSNNNSTSAELFIDSRKSTAFISVNQTYNDTGNRGAISFYRSEVYKGQISVDTTQVYYNTTSDYRLKENVVDVTDGIDFVKQLQPRSFNFINEPSKTIMGFVAHEVQDVVPNAVSGTKDGMQIWEEGEDLPDGFSVGDNKLDENGDTIPDYQCLDQAKLVPVLTAALKEAIAKIETLEAKVAALEAQ